MNQDNKEFELSGTLGSLNDEALNNLANQNLSDTNINPDNNTQNVEASSEIEMLDFSVPTNTPNTTDNVYNNPMTQSELVINNQLNDSNILGSENNLNMDVISNSQMDLNPIPTNFDIGDIGSVPPVDPTGKKDKKPKKKNVLFIFLVIVFILIIGALVFYYLRISKGTVSNAVLPKALTFNIGEELPSDINEYATFKSIASSNCVLNTKNVDTTKAGEYEYTITCGNNSYKGTITLKDTKAPEVKTKTIVKKVGDTITPEEFISECEDPTECKYSFEKPEEVTNNMNQAGTYEINLIISDTNNNSVIMTVKLIVLESDIKVYLNCSLTDQVVEGFTGTVSYIDKIGISPDSNYAGIYFKLIEFIATNEEYYNKIKNTYKETGTLEINNGIGIPTFDDENLTITIEEILSGEADFGSDYSSIKNHYETTKNYKCNIVNVN